MYSGGHQNHRGRSSGRIWKSSRYPPHQNSCLSEARVYRAWNLLFAAKTTEFVGRKQPKQRKQSLFESVVAWPNSATTRRTKNSCHSERGLIARGTCFSPPMPRNSSVGSNRSSESKVCHRIGS